MTGEVVPVAPATITLADGTVRSANAAVRVEEARARIVAIRTGAVVAGTEAAKIEAFNAEQVKAGKQMTGEQATRNDAYADQLRFATAIEKHLDKDGRVKSEIFNACKPLLSGYVLPAGITVNAQAAYMMLAVARKAGFNQAHVDAYLRAEIEMFS
jgi:hypothetical protein